VIKTANRRAVPASRSRVTVEYPARCGNTCRMLASFARRSNIFQIWKADMAPRKRDAPASRIGDALPSLFKKP
jgi:hypothetical protein